MAKRRDFELADQLVMVAIRLTRTLRTVTKPSKLSGPHVSAMGVIVHSGRITARDLARLEEVTPGAISRVVTALEQAGLVRRKADEKDSRLQWISPTAKGRRVVEKGHRRRLRPLAEVIACLPPAHQKAALLAVDLIDSMTKAVAAGGR